MKKIELLAPAGSMESLVAAVQNGADAVYMGGSKFSARAYASNFDEDNMLKSVNYCHLYGVKVYVTLNTLIKDSEIEEAFNYIKFLYTIGVDALIIQDTGIAFLISRYFPDFEIHASTQMTVHNGEGALFLKDQGFKRIVLSRELSLEEIKNISTDLAVDTEIFIHGALCVCYSGQCLFSSLIGGRSGNRGRCAQPCRLPYTLINKESQVESSAYILSPKDICTIDDIAQIIDTGTSSLKIEGRMKKPEYVAGVVEAYRKAIDSIYSEKDFDCEKENKKLLKLFNREGFSKAYLYGNKGRDMMAYSFPKNTGIILGKVQKDSTVQLEDTIMCGDGVRTPEEGFTVSKIIKNGEEVKEAFSGDRVKIYPSKYKALDVLYKTLDSKLMEELGHSFAEAFKRKIQLDLAVKFKINECLRLKTNYNGKEYSIEGDMVQTAEKKPVYREKLIENLTKSGDTPFKFDNVSFDEYQEGFLPVSSINSARRALVDEIEKSILNKRELKDEIYINNKPSSISEIDKRSFSCKMAEMPGEIISVETKEQLKASLEQEMNNIAINILNKSSDITLQDIISSEKANFYLKVPNIIKNEFPQILNTLEEYLPHIKGIITANLGIISLFHDRTSIIGDYKLNIFNKYALKFYEKYLTGTAISVELNKKEIAGLISEAAIPCQAVVYGKAELMASEYCPVGSVFGGRSGEKNCCEKCSKGKYALRDRKGEEFILRMDRFCRSRIYNSVATNLIPFLAELRKLKVNSFRLDFVDEDYQETVKVIENYKRGNWEEDFVNYTRGHYKRGVE